LRQRAELVDKVIRTRDKLKLLRDRSEDLRAALNRFKDRRAKQRA
jgi:BMFP domain-containing protein YqiC